MLIINPEQQSGLRMSYDTKPYLEGLHMVSTSQELKLELVHECPKLTVIAAEAGFRSCAASAKLLCTESCLDN